MSDERRVCDLSAAELLDAAWARCGGFGWAQGPWVLEVHVNDGVTRRVVPSPMPAQLFRPTLGRSDLDRIGAASTDNAEARADADDV